MKGKQNGKDPLTIKQKDERLHFLIKGTGYILLYGAVLIFVSSLVIIIFPNSAELEKGWAIAGFVLFGLWIILAFPFILFGKYDRNIFSKIFWTTLFADIKLKAEKDQIKFIKFYKNIFSKVFWTTLFANGKLKLTKTQAKFNNFWKEKKSKK